MAEFGWRKLGRDLLTAVFPVARRRPTLLISFDWVKDQLKLTGSRYRGMQTVEIAKIVGSLNRYQDFDRAFLPLHATAERTARLKRLQRALERGEILPPVRLYKVGDVYFVEDGHHRVAAARRQGAKEIDAEVIEFDTPVPLESGVTPTDILIKAEYADFLARTHLDRLRPNQRIEFSEPGRYRVLLDHIDVHRYFLGQEKKREIPYEQAVVSWYDNVYMPIVETFRRLEVLKRFSGRTEADLYVWLSRHLYHLRERYGPDVDLEKAVLDYANSYRLGWLARLFRQA